MIETVPHQLAIETRGLTKRFGARVAVDSIDLRVPQGCAFGFLGPNGAGKTTMIRMLLGLTRASGGSASLLGHPVPEERASALSRIGAIVEEPRFHPHLTGRENLDIVAAVRGAEARARIDGALERVGLADRGAERVRRYSLGMRQRLGVARCLLADPDLLILDEPTNGLDPAGIHEFRAMVRTLVEQENRTVFVSSHMLDEVERVCDFAAIVDHGRVVVQGPIDELGGGDGGQLLIGADDLVAARGLLSAHELVSSASAHDDGLLHVTVSGDVERGARALNTALVAAGVGISRLQPDHTTLEQRFLQVTSQSENTDATEVAA
jgi:ABC-2 type transport system ATP-binding protein